MEDMPVVVLPEPVTVTPVSAWGGRGQISALPAPCSLEEVMSETLAEELVKTEAQDIARACEEAESGISSEFHISSDNADTTSDLLLAQMLQFELDAEFDEQLKREQDKWNGASKVTVSYEKHRAVHPALHADTDYDHNEVIERKEKKDVTPQFNKSGISGKGKNIITKHDPELCGRKNAIRVMENFPPEFETGDGGNFDMRLPNHVYNQLKEHSKVENRRGGRLHEKKEHSTAELAVDAKTRLLMYKLVNSGVLLAINGVVSTGKESVIFHANGGSRENEVVPEECAVKVFKTTLASFRNRCQYVLGDVRFFKDEFKRQNPRKIMKIWAEKEMLNLHKMEKCGIPCPTVVTLKKHILVMSFLGNSQNAAPKLKDASLSVAEWQIAYEQCVEYLTTLYKKCLLVHADFSEYNLLWWKDRVYVIDVAQAVDTMHPGAMQFLLRDCRNISEFFTKRGVHDVPDCFQLFNDVTGLALRGKDTEFLSQIEKYEKDERLMQLGLSKTDYPFDFFFKRATDERGAEPMEPPDEEENSDDDADWTTDSSDDETESSPHSADTVPQIAKQSP